MSEEPTPAEPLEKPKKSFPWFYCLLALTVIVVLAGLTAPMVIRCPKKPDQTEATSNLRQIGLALFEFETEYGTFPSNETAKAVAAKNPENNFDLSGKSSNALFRQLFAANLTQSEQMFYAKVKGTRKPDGDISPGRVLEVGEVGFGYVSGLSTEGNPARAVAFCPIIPGTDRFDPKPFDGKAVVLRMDNSVTSLRINEDGYAMLGGKTLFELGGDTVWGQNVPDIRYPEITAKSKPSFFRKLFSK